MHHSISITLLAAAAMFSLPALADSSPPQPASSAPASPAATPQTSDSQPDPTKIIVCHLTPPPTGSHMGGGKVCKTKAEWDQITHTSRDDMELRQNEDLSHKMGPAN